MGLSFVLSHGSNDEMLLEEMLSLLESMTTFIISALGSGIEMKKSTLVI